MLLQKAHRIGLQETDPCEQSAQCSSMIKMSSQITLISRTSCIYTMPYSWKVPLCLLSVQLPCYTALTGDPLAVVETGTFHV